jgi:hypothetical protein
VQGPEQSGTLGAPDQGAAAASGPAGKRAIGSYGSYREAERAVDFLSDRKFPVERIQIVGEGLRTVEQVTGRASWGTAALSGAANGALVGGFFFLLFWLLDAVDPVAAWGWVLLYGLAFGAVVGLLFGVLFYALTGGRRDFSSVGGVQASRYVVYVDNDVADEAERLLSELPAAA